MYENYFDREWVTTNIVYYQNGKTQYGYVIKNRSSEKERMVSMNTVNKMYQKKLLDFGSVMKVATNKKKGLIRVHEGFKEDLTGIEL